MHTPTRPMPPCTIVASVAGALVLAAITGLGLGAVPPLPAGIVLGISLAAFYVTAIGAIRPSSPLTLPARPHLRRPDLAAPVSHTDLLHPPEIARVRAWRRARLAALGVPDNVAPLLAEDPSFSVHELNRLLAQGCPLATALRILWPA